MNVREYILDLSARVGLAAEAAEIMLPIAQRLEDSGLLPALWEQICEGRRSMGFFREHAKEFGCEAYELSLAATLLFTRNMREVYEREGYDTEIYWNSLKDIGIWAQACKDEFGYWGMERFGWLCGTLRGRLWRLGRMQFERIEFEEGRYEGNGVVLSDGDIVINTHIPQGEPLTPELRKDAFDRAVKFFGSNIFMCESWMLWPAHYEMLKPTSNVISFMDDFDIFKQHEYPGVNDLWRIFGYLPDYRPEKLPANSSMQRAYIKRMQENGGLTGCGYGIHKHE